MTFSQSCNIYEGKAVFHESRCIGVSCTPIYSITIRQFQINKHESGRQFIKMSHLYIRMAPYYMYERNKLLQRPKVHAVTLTLTLKTDKYDIASGRRDSK